MRGRLSSLVFADDVELGELAFSLALAAVEDAAAVAAEELLDFGALGFLTLGPEIKTMI